MSQFSTPTENPPSDKADGHDFLLRSSRNRDAWLSISKFLQTQKPIPKFKRKPKALDKARALVSSFSSSKAKA